MKKVFQVLTLAALVSLMGCEKNGVDTAPIGAVSSSNSNIEDAQGADIRITLENSPSVIDFMNPDFAYEKRIDYFVGSLLNNPRRNWRYINVYILNTKTNCAYLIDANVQMNSAFGRRSVFLQRNVVNNGSYVFFHTEDNRSQRFVERIPFNIEGNDSPLIEPDCNVTAE